MFNYLRASKCFHLDADISEDTTPLCHPRVILQHRNRQILKKYKTFAENGKNCREFSILPEKGCSWIVFQSWLRVIPPKSRPIPPTLFGQTHSTISSAEIGLQWWNSAERPKVFLRCFKSEIWKCCRNPKTARTSIHLELNMAQNCWDREYCQQRRLEMGQSLVPYCVAYKTYHVYLPVNIMMSPSSPIVFWLTHYFWWFLDVFRSLNQNCWWSSPVLLV